MKRFYTMAIALTVAIFASAQMTKLKEFCGFSYIPKPLAYGDELQIIVGDEKDAHASFDIYDTDFNKKKTISIDWPTETSYYIIEERDSVVTESGYSEDWLGTYNNRKNERLTFTWEEAIQYAAALTIKSMRSDYDDIIGYYEDIDGYYSGKQLREAPTDHIIVDNASHTIYVNPEYEYNEYGSKAGDIFYYRYQQYGNLYPGEYYVYKPEEGFLYRVGKDYKSTFTGHWKSSRSDNPYASVYSIAPSFYDADNAHEWYNGVITQTLFNTDDNYEYLLPILSPQPSTSNERDRDNDGIVDYKETYHRYYISGFKIMSENGNTLQEINFEAQIIEGYDVVTFYKINNKFYCYIISRIEGGSSKGELYIINPLTTSVKKMENVQLNIRPNVVDRSSMVTVELDDTDVARELIVTSMDGRIVERRDIPAGERMIQVPASRMASGMYNFTIRKCGTVEKNGKVIVK